MLIRQISLDATMLSKFVNNEEAALTHKTYSAQRRRNPEKRLNLNDNFTEAEKNAHHNEPFRN